MSVSFPLEVIQALSDKVHTATGVTSLGQSAWLLRATSAVLTAYGFWMTFLFPLPDYGLQILIGRETFVAAVLFWIPGVRADAVRLPRVTGIQGAYYGLRLFFLGAGCCDTILWACFVVRGAQGNRSQVTAWMTALFLSECLRFSDALFGEDRSFRSAFESGRLPSPQRPRVWLLNVTTVFLVLAWTAVATYGVSLPRIAIGVAGILAFVAGFLLLCTPRPPLWRGARRTVAEQAGHRVAA